MIAVSCSTATTGSTEEERGERPEPVRPPHRVEGRAWLQTFDAVDMYDGSSRVGAMARIFAWGPKSGEWELAAKWSVHGWMGDVCGGPTEQARRRSGTAPATLSSAPSQVGYGNGLGAPPFFRVVVADDEAHAMITVRRPSHAELTVFVLEPDRVPVELKRGDGEPFGEVDGAVFLGGRWYVSTPWRRRPVRPTRSSGRSKADRSRASWRVCRGSRRHPGRA